MNRAFDVATYAFLVAGILVLTRPGSKGPQFVRSLGGAFSGVVQAASGQKVTVATK
jgi:hypothetical protein